MGMKDVRSWAVYYPSGQKADRFFKTKEEAEIWVGVEGRTKKDCFPASVDPTHQLRWNEGGVMYGSKEGLLPPEGTWCVSSYLDDETVKLKKDPPVLSWRVSFLDNERFFKTKVEADLWIKTWEGISLSASPTPSSKEATHQLVWWEGDVRYGSQDGLLPSEEGAMPAETSWTWGLGVERWQTKEEAQLVWRSYCEPLREVPEPANCQQRWEIDGKIYGSSGGLLPPPGVRSTIEELKGPVDWITKPVSWAVRSLRFKTKAEAVAYNKLMDYVGKDAEVRGAMDPVRDQLIWTEEGDTNTYGSRDGLLPVAEWVLTYGVRDLDSPSLTYTRAPVVEVPVKSWGDGGCRFQTKAEAVLAWKEAFGPIREVDLPANRQLCWDVDGKSYGSAGGLLPPPGVPCFKVSNQSTIFHTEPTSWETDGERFKTRAEAERVRVLGQEVKASVEGATHELFWHVDGVRHGSRDGQLPPKDVVFYSTALKEPKSWTWGVGIVGFQTKAESDLERKLYHGYAENLPLRESSEPANHLVVWVDEDGDEVNSAKGTLPKPGVKFEFKEIRSWGLGFKTRAEADFWKGAVGYSVNVSPFTQEANRQLIWKEGGITYGSKDGLMPPKGTNVMYCSFGSLVDKEAKTSKEPAVVKEAPVEEGGQALPFAGMEDMAESWTWGVGTGVRYRTRGEAKLDGVGDIRMDSGEPTNILTWGDGKTSALGELPSKSESWRSEAIESWSCDGTRFKTRKEANWYAKSFAVPAPVVASLEEAVFQLWWEEDGKACGSRYGRMPNTPPEQGKRLVCAIDGEPESFKDTWAKKSWTWGAGIAFYSTKAEAELGWAKSGGAPIKESSNAVTSQLSWVEDGVKYGSKGGLLPPKNVDWNMTSSYEEGLKLEKDPVPVEAPVLAHPVVNPPFNSWTCGSHGVRFGTKEAAELYIGTTWPLEKSPSSFVYGSMSNPTHLLVWDDGALTVTSAQGALPAPGQKFEFKEIRSWGLFKTKAEADLYEENGHLKSLPLTLEAVGQLYWQEGGITYGSKAGLMPPKGAKVRYCSFGSLTDKEAKTSKDPVPATVDSPTEQEVLKDPVVSDLKVGPKLENLDAGAKVVVDGKVIGTVKSFNSDSAVIDIPLEGSSEHLHGGSETEAVPMELPKEEPLHPIAYDATKAWAWAIDGAVFTTKAEADFYHKRKPDVSAPLPTILEPTFQYIWQEVWGDGISSKGQLPPDGVTPKLVWLTPSKATEKVVHYQSKKEGLPLGKLVEVHGTEAPKGHQYQWVDDQEPKVAVPTETPSTEEPVETSEAGSLGLLGVVGVLLGLSAFANRGKVVRTPLLRVGGEDLETTVEESLESEDSVGARVQ